MNHKKKFIIILSVVILLSAGLGGFYTIKSLQKTSVDVSISTPTTEVLPETNAASVISFFPISSIDNLDQSILVSFSQAMVPLKILDQQAECPLTISPASNGTCRWISTQTVEFTPDQRKPATKYTVLVKSSGNVYTGNFTTPLLKWAIGQNESLREGIQLVFNFPVKIEQLKKYLEIKDINKNKIISVNVIASKTSGIYIIKPKSGMWNYLTTYSFSLTQNLDAQDGNISTKLANLSYTTNDSILSVDLLKSVNYGNNTGFENLWYNEGVSNGPVDVGYGYQNFYDVYSTKARSQSLLPTRNIVIDVYFDEAINQLSPQIIRFAKKDVLVGYSLSYIPESIRNETTNKRKEVLTKKKIRITITDSLENNSTYTISYAPDGKNVISKRQYRTHELLKVTRFLPISYSKVCLYTNNPLDATNNLVSTVPSARIQSISSEEFLNDNLMITYSKLKRGDTENFLKENDLCPAPKDDEIAYIINTRLNPSSKYQLTFSPKDIYGDKVAPITKSFVTEKIKDKDMFIYIGHPDKNTIPSHLPLIIDVQTINTNTANVDVCAMDIESYLNSKYVPNKSLCSQFTGKDINIKNKNWLLSSTKIDLEKDILGEKVKSQNNIIRVSGRLKSNDLAANTRNFSSVFVRSNISLMLEGGENKNILLATTYDGKLLSGLKFQGYNKNNDAANTYSKVSIIAKYNAQKGTYELSNKADVIVASIGFYRGMIDNETDVTENYDFGYIVGQSSVEKEFLYLYTERPIYKPGDTVYFKGLLRNFNFDGFKSANSSSKSSSGILMIKNEQGNELMRIPVGLDKNSNFDGSFVLPKEMNLGGYFIRYQKSNQEEIQTSTVFFVEEYKKPVFKVDVDLGKNDIIAGESIDISINPSYYFGGKITNTAGTYNILAQKYYFNAKDYSDFQFGEGNDYIGCIYRDECNYMDRSIDIADSDFMIDKNGNYKLNYKINNSEAEQLYTFTFEVKDPTTQRPVSKTVSKVIHATDGYVGIQLPYWNTKKQGIKLNVVTLDWNAQPKADSKITVKLIKQDWKAIKKQGVDSVFYNDYSLEEIQESSEILNTDNKGLLEKILMPKSDGEYKIEVSYLGKSGVPFVTSQTIYVSGNDPLLWRTENNSITKVIAEKTMVNVGDNAQYTIQSPINTGTIFVAIEKDDGILDYFTMPLTSYATKLILPIKKEYYPNIYIKLFLVGSQKDNPLPVYKRGLAISKVNTLGQKLDVKITTNKQLYLPGEKPEIEVLVTDDQGKPVSNANLSIGIVDQSLLALKGNPVKNPFAYFYDMKRYLGISTLLSLQTLVEKLEIKDTSDGSKGGDGGSMKGGNSKKKRGIFKDTAYRNANITTNAQGIAKIIADTLPDNLTTWVIEGLVNTDDTKLGVTTQTIQTALSLMINPNLPNMFSVDDKLVLHPVLFNKTDKEQLVSFSISGTYLTIKDPNQKIKVPAQGEVSLDFPVEIIGKNIPYDTQLASKIVMTATTANTEIRDDVQLFIPLIQNATRETVTTVGNIISGSAKEALDIPVNLQGLMTFTYSKSLFGSLLDGINSSLLGSYACLEQRFSTFMPHVYSKQLYTSAGKGADYDFKKLFIKQWSDAFDGYQNISLHNYIKLQLLSLEKFQNSDGGFVFRYDTIKPQISSVWLTNYVISSLANLRDLGYTVSDSITNKAIKYLKTQFYKDQKTCGNTKVSNPGCFWFAKQAMTTISTIIDWDSKDKEASTMRELIESLTQDNINTTDMLSKAILLGKLSTQKSDYKKDIAPIIAKVLNEQLVMEPKTAHIGKRTSSSDIPDTAALLEASSYVPELASKYNTIYDALQRRIAEQKKDGSRGSTQDTINVIKSLTRFISVNSIEKDEMKINTLIGKKELPTITLAKNDPFLIQKMQANLSTIDHNADVKMSSDSKLKSYYDMTMSYFLAAKDIPARYEGFVVKKDYYKYEDYMDIASKKSAERNKYIQGEIPYKSLKYPKAITTYLSTISNPTIGQVLVTNMTITTSEPREQVAIENFIPAGAELINPHLSTESKYSNNNQNNQNNQGGYGYGYNNNNSDYNEDLNQDSQNGETFTQEFTCDKEEFRTEKYFCYKENLEPGSYTVTSLIRMTHAGIFSIKPTMVFEFYHPENFGRTIGMEIIVK